MNVICSDKTGTLTEGKVKVESATDVNGVASEKVFLFAYLNAYYETGFTNPIDEAILTSRKIDLAGYQKHDEIPYDFIRKRLTISVKHKESYLMVTKGALSNILEVCSSVETTEDSIVDIASMKNQIQRYFEEFSNQGFRTLGIAYKKLSSESPGKQERRKGYDIFRISYTF